MTDPKIFIASYDVVNTTITGERQHTYLVLDADGDPTTPDDEQVIRGGLERASSVCVDLSTDGAKILLYLLG